MKDFTDESKNKEKLMLLDLEKCYGKIAIFMAFFLYNRFHFLFDTP
jgi:hypothetical protein